MDTVGSSEGLHLSDTGDTGEPLAWGSHCGAFPPFASSVHLFLPLRSHPILRSTVHLL